MLNFEDFTILSLDDNKKRDNAKLRAYLPYDREKITEYNNKGAGIFFSTNPQINPLKHSRINTREWKYISLDLDVAKIEDKLSKETVGARKVILLTKIKSLKIQPNYIIETNHGYQPLWEFSNGIVLSSVKERLEANELYKKTIAGFTAKTGLESEGDSISRLVRLPETYHQKDPNNPFLIKIYVLNPNKVTLEDFIKVYPPVEDKVFSFEKKKPIQSGSVIEKIIYYSVKEALIKISGSKEVNHEQFSFSTNSNGTLQLIVDGRRTGQWIDIQNNTIGGAGIGAGNPTIIQFVQWYGVRRGDDKTTARSNAILFLKKILSITDEQKKNVSVDSLELSNNKYINTNVDVDVNDNGGCKKTVNFELTQSKQRVIADLKKCNYRTSPKIIATLLENFFKVWPSFDGYWLSIAQKYPPRAIWRTIDDMVKTNQNGMCSIRNASAYFSSLIKYRKPRKIKKRKSI
ncbi:MAG: hypothetical protein NTZ55_04465 [Candidatus Roizmanbacteria bacterium]|nr:hypothetical protein [Candidatus Roizmanbacteria bacterium]